MNKLSKNELGKLLINELENGFIGTTVELQEKAFKDDNYLLSENEANELIEDLGKYQSFSKILDFDFEMTGELMTDLNDITQVARKVVYINMYEILSENEQLMETWQDEINDSNRKALINEFEEKYL